jgi:hypothetical protein
MNKFFKCCFSVLGWGTMLIVSLYRIFVDPDDYVKLSFFVSTACFWLVAAMWIKD